MEVAKVGGGGSDHIRTVLPGSGPGSATLWGRNPGAISSNV